jgi:hypothetical protein
MKETGFGGPAPRVRRWLALLTGIILSAALILAAGTMAAAAPLAAVTATSFNFGKVYEDKALSHTFTITNLGDEPLELEDVDPDCACTVPRYDRVIPPGGQGEVTLTIKPYSVMRDFIKNTKVSLNDPEHPELTLTLKGYVQPIIEIQPSHIIRLRGAPGKDLRGQVRFISHLSAPWKITGYENSIPQMVAVSLKEEKPGKVYVLEVRNLRREEGHYAGVIRLETTSVERPRLIVRVFANLYPSGSGSF